METQMTKLAEKIKNEMQGMDSDEQNKFMLEALMAAVGIAIHSPTMENKLFLEVAYFGIKGNLPADISNEMEK